MTRAALVLAYIIATAFPVLAQTEDARSMVVKGQGAVSRKPTTFGFDAYVVTEGTSVEAASAQHQDRLARALNALRALEGEGLTIGEAVAEFNQDRRPRYRHKLPVKIRVSEHLNDIVTSLLKTAVIQIPISSIQYQVDDRAALDVDALKAAVKDAVAKAQAIAGAANVQLDGPVSIRNVQLEDEERCGPPQFVRTEADLGQMIPAAGPMIVPASVQAAASVEVIWRIKGAP